MWRNEKNVTLQNNKNINRMKKIYSLIVALFATASMLAQGWPAQYGGVMLQGFSWDSYVDTKWTNLESQADELSQYFNLIWIPQSGNCNTSYNNMGYMPVYYFNQNSSFGTENELRSMIKTFKAKGTGMIADVVINHRNNLGAGGSWTDFPEETYKGVKYQMLPSDICGNDDGGKTKTWATGKGQTLGNNDTGEDWSGCRDLDHSSSNVQKCINAYLKYLLDDLGYTGLRYDMTKGYAGSYTAAYNKASGVKYSVGEYWDGNVSNLKGWVDRTKDNGTIMSAAFDFPFRYTVRDAVNANSWTKLGNSSLMRQAGYSQFAVTFVENHDTQYRSSTEQQDPIKKDTLAANAFMLAMPGTPCVFLPHWKAYKQEIKGMIDLRKAMGITNTSAFTTLQNSTSQYAVSVNGENGTLAVVVGNDASKYTNSNYVKAAGGWHYALLLAKKSEMAWVDKASGTYEDAINVTLTAASANSNAKVVYTADGSEPKAASNPSASGTTVKIDATTTLKVGLLVNGVVSKVTTREYTIKPFVAHKATVYLKVPEWSPVYFYAWDASKGLLGSWPGTQMTETVEKNGEKWYSRDFDINASGYSFNIIFNQGNGKLQTADIGPISEDTYFEYTETAGGRLVVKDITQSVTTGIDHITITDKTTKDNGWYSINGMRLNSRPTQKGMYIHQGKKYVIK